jgi:hypothetical protein
MKRPVLIAAALAVFFQAAPVSAAGNGEEEYRQEKAFRLGQWIGTRFVRADNTVNSCTLTMASSSRTLVAIALFADGGLSLLAAHEGWKFTRDTVEADMMLDGVTVATQLNVPYADTLQAYFTPPDDQAAFERLRLATVLDVRTRKGGETYDLTGLAEAMPALHDCVAAPPAPSASPAARGAPSAGSLFDIPGSTRPEASQVMAIMANVFARNQETDKQFLMGDEIATLLPGYDVAWRGAEGELGAAAVRGGIKPAGRDAILGALMGKEAARCPGGFAVALESPESQDNGTIYRALHTTCDGGGNGKQSHYATWYSQSGLITVMRFEPITMENPAELRESLEEENPDG